LRQREIRAVFRKGKNDRWYLTTVGKSGTNQSAVAAVWWASWPPKMISWESPVEGYNKGCRFRTIRGARRTERFGGPG